MRLLVKYIKKNVWCLLNSFLLFPSLIYIFLLRNKINLSKVRVFNFLSQKNGSLNFTAYHSGKKVFIKFSFFYKNLANEELAYKFLEKIKKNFFLPKIIYIDDKVFISEFISESDNLFNLLNANPALKIKSLSFIKSTLRVFQKNKFKHNDFLLRNILFSKNKFYIVDFYFSSFKGSLRHYNIESKNIAYGFFNDKNCDEKTIFHDLIAGKFI